MQPLKPDAGQRFADVGLKSIAEDPPSEHRDLMIYINAIRRGYATIIQTTFRDRLWNGPLYERLGFVA